MSGRTRRVKLHTGASVLISVEPARTAKLPTLQAAKFVPGDFGEPPPLSQVQGGGCRSSCRRASELATAPQLPSPRKRSGLRERSSPSHAGEAALAPPPPAEAPPDEPVPDGEEENAETMMPRTPEWRPEEGGGARQLLWRAARVQQKFEAEGKHSSSRRRADAAWRAGHYEECSRQLREGMVYNNKCDSLLRYRARALRKQGKLELALYSARRAVELSPRTAVNHVRESRTLQQLGRLQDAGMAQLGALQAGLDQDEPSATEYHRIVDAVQRNREYYSPRLLVQPHAVRPDIFDPSKVLESGLRLDGIEPPGKPPLHLQRVGYQSMVVRWEPPEFEGGDDVFEFQLRWSQFKVAWLPAECTFSEEWTRWTDAHKGPPRVLRKELKVEPGQTYQLQVRCRNVADASPWSDTLEVVTPGMGEPVGGEEGEGDESEVPRSWLHVDLHDVDAKSRAVSKKDQVAGGGGGDDIPELTALIEAALRPHTRMLRRLFTKYTQMGIGRFSPNCLNLSQYTTFVKDCGLVQLGADNTTRPVPAYSTRARVMPIAETDLIFSRSIAKRIQKRKHSLQAANKLSEQAANKLRLGGATRNLLAPAAPEPRKSVDEMLAQPAEEEEDDDDVDDEDEELASSSAPAAAASGDAPIAGKKARKQAKEKANGDGSVMGLVDWIGALVRLAWSAYNTIEHMHVGERLTVLFEEVVLPCAAIILDRNEDQADALMTPRVRAVMNHYVDRVVAIFMSYARSDVFSSEARESLDTINLAELCFMCTEGKLLDTRLTLIQLTSMFDYVNTLAEEDADYEHDDREMDFDEFVLLLVRICFLREQQRSHLPFELTLQHWLHATFLPDFEHLLHLKKRGLIDAKVRRNLNGTKSLL